MNDKITPPKHVGSETVGYGCRVGLDDDPTGWSYAVTSNEDVGLKVAVVWIYL